MSTPQPVPKAGIVSAATLSAGTSGALASLLIYFLGLKGITFPAGVEAGIASLFALVGSHLPKVFQLRA